ncbi:MAG: alpha-galactosidase [Bacteroidaceae bacterium]|nr:alpha-galactosidase [Bacteroidaceae bacterium]
MKKTFFCLLAVSALCVLPSSGFRPPTMGWSSWNTFALNINEDVILGQAEAMVKTGLAKAGYKYINIDDGYFLPHDKDTKMLGVRDDLFPHGMRYVADEIHKLGLKAGIYSDAGANACGGSKDIGYYGYEVEDNILFFDTWDYDFVKVDYCGGRQLKLDEEEQYTKIIKAIRDNVKKKDVVFNICRWAYPGTWVSDWADSWRTTGDIYCAWPSVRSIIKENLYLSEFTHDGHYNDMDMLEIGRTLTPDEEITHMAVWCILSSPLLIGCDMSQIPEFSLNLMKNPELIAINQDVLGIGAPVVQRQGEVYVFAKDLKKVRGKERAVCVTNLTDEVQTIDVDINSLGYEGTISVRDIVNHKEFAPAVQGKFKVTVPAHGSQVFVTTGAVRNEPTRYEAEASWMKEYQEISDRKTATFGDCADASGGKIVTTLGGDDDNYMEWKQVFSKKGGDYDLTIKYICGENRPLAVSVNGEDLPELKNLNGGSWEKVAAKTVRVKLRKGMNTIRLGEQDSWAPNIDCIELSRI